MLINLTRRSMPFECSEPPQTRIKPLGIVAYESSPLFLPGNTVLRFPHCPHSTARFPFLLLCDPAYMDRFCVPVVLPFVLCPTHDKRPLCRVPKIRCTRQSCRHTANVVFPVVHNFVGGARAIMYIFHRSSVFGHGKNKNKVMWHVGNLPSAVSLRENKDRDLHFLSTQLRHAAGSNNPQENRDRCYSLRRLWRSISPGACDAEVTSWAGVSH